MQVNAAENYELWYESKHYKYKSNEKKNKRI
jgi:hypothetical protein